MQALRKAALRYAGTQAGVAREGTPIESRTVKTRNKAFLFLTMGHARLKLQLEASPRSRPRSVETGRGRSKCSKSSVRIPMASRRRQATIKA